MVSQEGAGDLQHFEGCLLTCYHVSVQKYRLVFEWDPPVHKVSVTLLLICRLDVIKKDRCFTIKSVLWQFWCVWPIVYYYLSVNLNVVLQRDINGLISVWHKSPHKLTFMYTYNRSIDSLVMGHYCITSVSKELG